MKMVSELSILFPWKHTVYKYGVIACRVWTINRSDHAICDVVGFVVRTGLYLTYVSSQHRYLLHPACRCYLQVLPLYAWIHIHKSLSEKSSEKDAYSERGQERQSEVVANHWGERWWATRRAKMKSKQWRGETREWRQSINSRRSKRGSAQSLDEMY